MEFSAPILPSDEQTFATPSEIADSQSLDAQVEQELACCDCLKQFQESSSRNSQQMLMLLREEHIEYLNRRLRSLPASFSGLDASQAWLAYWSVHALHLLGEDLESRDAASLAKLLATMQCREGGFGGGPHQLAHLAVTFAAVNCLCILDCLDLVNRVALTSWLRRLKLPDGSFRMQLDGEVDVRGIYCAASVARLLELTDFDQLFAGTAEWVARCQTYEGGFGGVPGSEAHGGYAYCAFAALTILGRTELCDSKRLLRWAAQRQMRFEGGFQGRTNKLVDSCYSFWLAGIFPCIQSAMPQRLRVLAASEGGWLFNRERLQAYVLACCQKRTGGLYDKPPGSPDPYHCCYALSGLSLSQHCQSPEVDHRYRELYASGQRFNQLRQTCHLHNIGPKFLPQRVAATMGLLLDSDCGDCNADDGSCDSGGASVELT